MKPLAQILAPLLAALLGYVAAGAFRPGEEKPRAEVATPSSPQARPSPTMTEESPLVAVASALVALNGTPSLADLASIQCLSPAQMADLLQRALTMRLPSDNSGDNQRTERLGLLMDLWLARDPEAATQWMLPKLELLSRLPGFGAGYANAETALVGRWARSDPKRALEVARKYPRSELAFHILRTAIYAWPDEDNARRFALLRDFPAGPARQRIMRTFCESWARTDFPAALDAIASMAPDAERTEALRNSLGTFAGKDPAGALSRAETFGIADDPKTVQRLAMAAGDKAPWVTARWLEARGPELLRSAGPALVRTWAEKEPAAAFDWARKHGIDIAAPALAGADAETRNRAMRGGVFRDSPMEVALEKNSAAVLTWLRAQPPGAARDTAVVQTLRAMREPSEMMPLLAMLPPEAAPQGAEAIAGRFNGLTFDAGKQWAEGLPAGPTRTAAWTAMGQARGGTVLPKLPPGPDRDAMLHGMTQGSFYKLVSPERAMEPALAIDDAKLRRQTFDEVMSTWATNPKHRDSAAPWLSQAAVPEEWKTRWRERLK